MPVKSGKNQRCEKCGKTMDENEFYTYRDGTKTELCKKCLTMHIDNFDPKTYLWLLEKMDVPYVEQEWNVLRDRAFAKNPYKMNGMSVFGKYIAKMKLNQWNKYHWSDTEQLQAEVDAKNKVIEEQREEEAESAQENLTDLEKKVQERFDKGEITESEYKTLMPVNYQLENVYATGNPVSGNPITGGGNNPYQNSDLYLSEEDMDDLNVELSKEEKLRYAVKWGRLYKPSEWLALEKDYQEMVRQFDIRDADTLHSLILLCKSNLKANQAIDVGDLDGFKKLSSVSDSLRKSMKLTAAQNKDGQSGTFNSIGELVAYCEKYGGKIPKYEISTDQDVIDKIIRDLKDYTRTLIYEDSALARQIEDYIKKKETLDKMKKDRDQANQLGLDDVPVNDSDYEEHFNLLEHQRQQDQLLYGGSVDD